MHRPQRTVKKRKFFGCESEDEMKVIKKKKEAKRLKTGRES